MSVCERILGSVDSHLHTHGMAGLLRSIDEQCLLGVCYMAEVGLGKDRSQFEPWYTSWISNADSNFAGIRILQPGYCRSSASSTEIA